MFQVFVFPNVFENYRDENRAYSPTTTTTTTAAPPTTTAAPPPPPPTAAAASLNAHMRGKMAAGARSGGAAARAQRRGARNKLAVRSGRWVATPALLLLMLRPCCCSGGRGPSWAASSQQVTAIHLEGAMTAASADWVGVTDGEAGGRYCTVLHCTMGDAFTEHGVIGKIFVAKKIFVTPSVLRLKK